MGFPRVGSNPTGVAFFDATTHGSREWASNSKVVSWSCGQGPAGAHTRLGDADAAKNGNRFWCGRALAPRGVCLAKATSHKRPLERGRVASQLLRRDRFKGFWKTEFVARIPGAQRIARAQRDSTQNAPELARKLATGFSNLPAGEGYAFGGFFEHPGRRAISGGLPQKKPKNCFLSKNC